MPDLLTQNAKMKASSLPGLWNFGIPAYREAGGKVTCPMAGQCGKDAGCYAQMERYIQTNVKNAYQWRYDQTKDLKAFEAKMRYLLCASKYKTIRVHDSGDFYSPKYTQTWLSIAQAFPETQFYAYTKMVTMAHQNESLTPPNWTWIFSLGGQQDHLIDLKKDRHSRVFQNLEDLTAAGYADASHDDAVALGPNHRVGLIYHGYSSRSTQWK